MKAVDVDRMFDDGEDVSQHFDWSKARRPHQDKTRLTVEIASTTALELDNQAQLQGITREELLQTWIEERLR